MAKIDLNSVTPTFGALLPTIEGDLMAQANLGQQIGYQLRGEYLNRMDLYVSQGIIAGNIESIEETAQIWRIRDHEQYVTLVQQMERLGERANAQTINLTNATERQTQAVHDLKNRLNDVGENILDSMSQIQKQLASCENTIQNGFNLTIEAIENFHKEITSLLRKPQATRAHELVDLAKKRLANSIANPRHEKQDVELAERLINEALETPVGQTISQAWYLRGWLELNTFNEPLKAITSFENARRVAEKKVENLIAYLYCCKAMKAAGDPTGRLIHESMECLYLATFCLPLREEVSIETLSIVFDAIKTKKIPPKNMEDLRERIDLDLGKILFHSPHLLPRLFANADSESKNTLLRLYNDLCDNARNECQKIIDAAESILDFIKKLHRNTSSDFTHEINAMNRHKQDACHILPGRESDWKSLFRNTLSQINTKLAGVITLLQREKTTAENRIQAIKTQYETECEKKIDIFNETAYAIFGQGGVIACFVYGIWIRNYHFAFISPIVYIFLILTLVIGTNSYLESQAKTDARIKYNRSMANVKHPKNLENEIGEIEQSRSRIHSFLAKHF